MEWKELTVRDLLILMFAAILCAILGALLVNCAGGGSSADAAPPGLKHDPAHYGSVVTKHGLIRKEAEVIVSGFYTLQYQVCVVNNLADPTFNILVQANLFINNDGLYQYIDAVKSKGFNVCNTAHYGVITLLWSGWLEAGDLVEIQVRADTGRGIIHGGAIIIDVRPEGFNANVWETFIMFRIDAINTEESIFLLDGE